MRLTTRFARHHSRRVSSGPGSHHSRRVSGGSEGHHSRRVSGGSEGLRSHRLCTLLMAALCLLVMAPARAQSLMQQANDAMQQFVQLSNSGSNTKAERAQMYQALYKCYTGYVAVLQQAGKGTPDYAKAKESLRLIYPSLQQAATFYSSNGQQAAATQMACACIDMPKMEAFQGETFPQDSYYPTIVYFAAGNKFNARDYQAAARYYTEYLRTGEQTKRKKAYAYLATAYQKQGDNQRAAQTMAEAVVNYPNDYDVLSSAINSAIEAKDYQHLAAYLDKALALRPGSQDLLNIQGRMLEDQGNYQQALAVYEQLQKNNPRSLSVAEHVAMNRYNLGVLNYNKAALESNSATATGLRQQSAEHFREAVKWLQQIVQAKPTSVKYTQALAVAYSCLGDNRQLEATNQKLAALGQERVPQNVAPMQVKASDQTVLAQNGTRPAAGTTPATTVGGGSATTPAASAVGQEAAASAGSASTPAIPRFSDFAREYIDGELKRWSAKDPYETVSEFKARVNNETQQKKAAELRRKAERDYIQKFAQTPTVNILQLMPYDAENQAFLIRSPYGDMVLPVSRERNEARIFESNWRGMQFKDPQFFVSGDTITLASLTFVTPTGKSYTYSNQEGLEYIETSVDVELAQIDYGRLTEQDNSGAGNKAKIGKRKVNIGMADVDKNIPTAKTENPRTFAIIISNEKYQHVPEVPMANNDGNVFAQYCIQTLGIPMRNVRGYTNATLGTMMSAVQDLKNISDAFQGDIQVIFYYAGHGIPDEATKDAYLLPVDADGRQMTTCYSLKKLYSELSALKAKSVVVFLDACFSGATPDGGNLMASARGVAIKAKETAPQGNMVVFSAASGTETAYPYEEMGHGMFTYFLLKKLQQSKGNATLRELGEYIVENVKQNSVLINRKPQTPTVTPSAGYATEWQTVRLKP